MVNWKIWAGLFGAAALFIAGYQYAAAMYGADIAALREDYASRAQVLEAEYRKKEGENARAVVAAWEERDRARNDAVRLDADLARVRDEADALKRKLSRAPADSCSALRAELAECAELCKRGAELLDRGSRLVQEVAADKDAIVRITQ